MRILDATELVYVNGGSDDYDEAFAIIAEFFFEFALELAEIIIEDFIFAVSRSIYYRYFYTPEVMHTTVVIL
ncbi:MAG: hypothetical protein BGO43_00350 [Gammaproteobacteria bacterium 39-13]|nr:hypothetical protein [Gammaproteobacteria bacterium]OJV96712.1 MAG: hypothetical protein BGO43_00350 [Gammaproteobacteria bacterium 39-13]